MIAQHFRTICHTAETTVVKRSVELNSPVFYFCISFFNYNCRHLSDQSFEQRNNLILWKVIKLRLTERNNRGSKFQPTESACLRNRAKSVRPFFTANKVASRSDVNADSIWFILSRFSLDHNYNCGKQNSLNRWSSSYFSFSVVAGVSLWRSSKSNKTLYNLKREKLSLHEFNWTYLLFDDYIFDLHENFPVSFEVWMNVESSDRWSFTFRSRWSGWIIPSSRWLRWHINELSWTGRW